MKAETVQMTNLRRRLLEGDPTAPKKLTAEQQRSLLATITKHCPENTREVLRERIDRPLIEWPGCWEVDRLYIEGDRVFYCAGQDYLAEIASLRKRLHDWR